MKFYPTLQETLAKRFTDMDEVNDISNHGIMGGFGDFIYHVELAEFFNEFTSEIEDVIEEFMTMSEFMGRYDSVTEMMDNAVWFVVEEFCHRKVELCAAA